MTIITENVMVHRKRNIGRLDHALRLPIAGRIRYGMKTNCKSCLQPITDEFFVVGFKNGERNIMLHETCLAVGYYKNGTIKEYGEC